MLRHTSHTNINLPIFKLLKISSFTTRSSSRFFLVKFTISLFKINITRHNENKKKKDRSKIFQTDLVEEISYPTSIEIVSIVSWLISSLGRYPSLVTRERALREEEIGHCGR